jgi:predicted transcriptional regulator
MSNRDDAKNRGILLKELRAAHQESVARTQALLKEQKASRRLICSAMRDAPKTVPEIAAAIDMPAKDVLWHLMAMKKYDLIAEAGMCGEYYLYQMVEEQKR